MNYFIRLVSNSILKSYLISLIYGTVLTAPFSLTLPPHHLHSLHTNNHTLQIVNHNHYNLLNKQYFKKGDSMDGFGQLLTLFYVIPNFIKLSSVFTHSTFNYKYNE